ncbi:MAG: phenylalanine--tRNA ligase subunit beta, partial [Ginsengibacter sp.]
MKISYNWVREYLPQVVLKKGAIDSPEIMASILTSVGLEVETIHKYEEIPNSLDGLLIGEVISCEKHSNADKLKVAQVNIGQDHALQIVCGAPNISTGQKVVVAPVGTTLFPISGESFSIKNSKIRGIESQGMICAEDEIGLGSDHSGIIILPETTVPGEDATSFFKVYEDWIFDIGLTPNRVDAMSHLGVAKDLCAHFSHHNHSRAKVVDRYPAHFSGIDQNEGIKVELVDTDSCRRYSGIVISGIKVLEAPRWMKDKLKSIGIRPINNIVDITNFILHETGQPLHAFDADKIKRGKIVVKCLSSGAKFTTLDNKERTLDKEDLMICDGAQDPMCFGGVFGGAYSGVTENTTNIFLESAWFDPVSVRKTSFRHNLRTEAATHFEKGVDISNTVNVLKRAAMLIKEYAGGEFLSGIVDVYPNPLPKTQVTLKSAYLKKLSGKVYDMGKVKNIFESLNFETIGESAEQISVKVPFSNPDISLPADLVEEIMRIDGLDNVTISDSVNISPSIEIDIFGPPLKEKMAGWLTG